MGSAERRERERRQTKTAILDAARSIMSERGFEGLTMRAVADRIEYTAAALYKHFSDREDLVRELCAHDFYEFTQALRSRPGALHFDPKDPYAQLRAIAHGYVEFAMGHPEQYRVMFMSPVPLEPNVVGKGNPESDAYAVLELAVEAAQARGCVPGLDRQLVAQTAWATMHGVVSLEISHLCAKKRSVAFAPLAERVRLALESIISGMESVAHDRLRLSGKSKPTLKTNKNSQPSRRLTRPR